MNLGTYIANAPTYFRKMERKADIAYGKNAWQKLDIYTPGNDSQNRPVVIYFYGGRWSSGSKSYYRFVAARLAKAGYVVVIPDYVKYPQAKFPAFMRDAAVAVAWTERHMGEYGGNASQIYILGHSAGAHMGALLISDPRYLAAAGASPQAIAAFAGLAGPYAFTPDEPDVKDIFGPPARYPKMQVPTFIRGTEPPMFLAYGNDDTSVQPENTLRLADAVHAHGGIAVAKAYPDMGHIGIIARFSGLSGSDEVAEDCIAFFKKHPGKHTH